MLAQADNLHPNVVFVNRGKPPDFVESLLTPHQLRIKIVLVDPGLIRARAVGSSGFPTTLFYSNGRRLIAHLGKFSRATFDQALEHLYPTVASKAVR